MKINLDGTFDIEKGETVPFICPKCRWPTEFQEKILMVRCKHCGHLGDTEEFSSDFSLVE